MKKSALQLMKCWTYDSNYLLGKQTAQLIQLSLICSGLQWPFILKYEPFNLAQRLSL